MGPRSDPVEKPENRWLDRFDPSIHRFDCAAAPEGRADREDPRWQLRYSTAATPILRQTSAATGDGFLFVPSSLAAGTQLLPPILGPRHPASQAPARCGRQSIRLQRLQAWAARGALHGCRRHGRRRTAWARTSREECPTVAEQLSWCFDLILGNSIILSCGNSCCAASFLSVKGRER
jgi:hypothetical protein